MWIDLVELDLVSGFDLPLDIEDDKSRRGRALIDGTNELFVRHR